jgi:L-ascorbate metabolism protein UlaG (beta-lactamase superfamily)
VRLTHVGGPTVLLEVEGWRLLTDPTFDGPGRRYDFGWGTSSRKLTGPAVSIEDIGPIDAVLLTHEHHADNLDDAGRALLPSVGTVLTTRSGAARLAGNAQGLDAWATSVLQHAGLPPVEVTATPCRHGPPGSRPIVGDVIGFSLRWDGQRHGTVWISGDTVLHRGIREVAQRIDVGTALVHLGGVRFPITGPIRYTMRARHVAAVCELMRPHTTIPVHYEGWSHFREPQPAAEIALERAGDAVRSSLRWIPIGVAVEVEA